MCKITKSLSIIPNRIEKLTNESPIYSPQIKNMPKTHLYYPFFRLKPEGMEMHHCIFASLHQCILFFSPKERRFLYDASNVQLRCFERLSCLRRNALARHSSSKLGSALAYPLFSALLSNVIVYI